MASVLTVRDLAILSDIRAHRVCTRKELQIRHFPNVSPQFANRRLSKILKRFPDRVKEIRLGQYLSAFTWAEAQAGGVIFPEHDLFVARLRTVMGSRVPGIWITEDELRSGTTKLLRSDGREFLLSRTPDAIWRSMHDDRLLLGLEFERTLKNKATIKQVIASYEERTTSELSKVFFLCETSTIARAYEAATVSVKLKLPLHLQKAFVSRTRIVDLELVRSSSLSRGHQYMDAVVDCILSEINQRSTAYIEKENKNV